MLSEQDAWLTRAQFDLYWKSTRHNFLLLPIAAYLINLAVSPWVNSHTRLLWWVSVAVTSLAIHFAGRWIDEHSSENISDLRVRAISFVILNVLFFGAWCSMGVVLWVPGLLLDHMMIILVLACSLAGTIAITATHPAIAFCALILHALFLIGPAATSPIGLDRRLAELAVLFVLLVAGQFVALNMRTSKMLRLEHEQTDLVRNLRLAKAESDRAQARAAAAGQAKSQFLSHMNHELRTPMNAILGFSEMIQKRSLGGPTDKYSEYAGIIHESGQTLLTLINGVLDLAKIEGGRLSLREAEVDVGRLVRDAVERAESRAEQAGVTLCCSASADLPLVRGDERALGQILANLFANALKFTPAGGCITGFACRERDGRIAFGVEDSGVGMSAEDQLDVFERFGRGRHDITTTDRGTGLGLAIVKGFAEAHDGEVRLDSKLGKGTRVTVCLPEERVLLAMPLKAIA
jgi:two-component system, cell cycle sensor histidine kinase PleC